MPTIEDLDELRALTDDPYLLWAARGFPAGVRAWAYGTAIAPPPDERVDLAGREDDQAIDALLDTAFPTSLARPARTGVRRWWIVRGEGGLDACGADAWSTEGMGFLAGVATSTAARGRGDGRAVAATAIAALVRDYAAAALMIDADNVPARKLYESFGMSYRPLRAMVPRGLHRYARRHNFTPNCTRDQGVGHA